MSPQPAAPKPPPSHRSKLRRRGRWLAGLAVIAVVSLWLGFFGRNRLQLQSPRSGAVVGVKGIELLLRFPPEAGFEPATLRVTLNGADVSESVESGENGAYGEILGLLDGENRLRIEVFRRSPWVPSLMLEQSREVQVLYRPPLHTDRA